MIGYDVHGAFDDTLDDSDGFEETQQQLAKNIAITPNTMHPITPTTPNTPPTTFITTSTSPTKNQRLRWHPQRVKRNVSLRQKKEVAYRQKYKCFYCDMLLLPSYQVDHFIPLWQGGTNETSNLVATCGNCHNEKTAKENDRRSPYFTPHRAKRPRNKTPKFTDTKSV